MNADNRPLRILFIHEVNYLSKVIFEMHEFPELLALRGHRVSFFHYPEGAGARSWRTTRREIAGRVHADARITLITPPTAGGGPLERYAAPLTTLPSLRRELRSGAYDLVVLYAVPTTGWQTVAIARRAGVPVVFRALDVSHLIRRSAVAALIRRAEKSIYRRADVVSANNPAMAEYTIDESGRSGPTVVNLPPVDLSHFTGAADAADLRPSLGLGDAHRVILYMGTFFGFSGLEQLIRGLVPHFAAHPELRLVLVGGGELDARLRAVTTELGLDERVIFTGVIPYAELPGYLRAADVAVNPFELSLLTHVAFPHKVLQYMAAGTPAVSTSLRGLRGVLGDESGVTWVDTPADVAAAAVQIALAPAADRAAIAAAQRGRVTQLFDRDSATDSFESTLYSVR